MEREDKWNGQAAMNNNTDAATIQMNQTIAKQHVKPKEDKPENKKIKDVRLH